MLRAFVRQFGDSLPDDYYRFINGGGAEPDWGNLYPVEWAAAKREAWQLELGAEDPGDRLDARLDAIREASGGNTVLIGGPPCQAYSLVGRARNRGKEGYVASKDARHFLYREYIRILDRLRPAAFVMENVKGILKRDADSLRANRNVAVALAKALDAEGMPLASAEPVSGGYLLPGVPVGLVREFIASFVNHPGSLLTDTGPVCQHIDDRAATELAHWDVLFASLKKREDMGLSDDSLGITINCPRRSEADRSRNDPTTLRVTNKQRVASRGVEKTGLTDAQIEDAQREYRERDDAKPSKDGSWNYPDRIYRAKRERPLLTVHLLAIGAEEDDLRGTEPVVAWSISFPGTELEEKKVAYVVNTTWVRENFSEDLEEEEMAGDDDR